MGRERETVPRLVTVLGSWGSRQGAGSERAKVERSDKSNDSPDAEQTTRAKARSLVERNSSRVRQVSWLG